MRFIDGWGGKMALAAVSLLATTALAGYQRRTGPTWPVAVNATVAGTQVSGHLPRTHPGRGGARLELTAPAPVAGEVRWRRYPSADPWSALAMTRDGDRLSATLPHLPPAGKLEYSVRLRAGGESVVAPAPGAAVVRYRGDVPSGILLPHILFMFLALLLAVRAGLGAALGELRTARFVPWTLALLVPGGLVLGPLVQKLAFGAYWTGWPFGEDWTDNKTLVAVLVWGAAWWLARRRPRREAAVVAGAAAVMIGVYLVPHSMNGSELDWSAVPAETAR